MFIQDDFDVGLVRDITFVGFSLQSVQQARGKTEGNRPGWAGAVFSLYKKAATCQRLEWSEPDHVRHDLPDAELDQSLLIREDLVVERRELGDELGAPLFARCE